MARIPATAYVVGGTAAVLEGWRDSTKDVDVVFEPEPREIFEGIARLKDTLSINVEVAAPSRLVPEVPGWRDRSRWVLSTGNLHVYHYDPVSQALAKIERGHAQDLDDVAAMIDRGWLDAERLRRAFDAIAPDLVLRPAIDPAMFRQKLEDFLRDRD